MKKVVFISLITMTAYAQNVPPASQNQKAPPAPSVWSVGLVDFSGVVDAYYTENFNHPQLLTGVPGTNALYNFNVQANQFSLNMVKLTMSHDPEPVGFRVDLGFGKAFDNIHASEPSGSTAFLRNIEQAYVSVKSKHGFQVDFGQFVTAAGAEVIETKDDWNYSRSLLFSWAVPYYHFGLRTTLPVGSHFTGDVQLVNGWNNVEDNNSGKTLGFVGNFTFKKVTWSNDYYTGPENTGTNKGWRNLYDATLLLTPSDKMNFYINFDYGRNRSSDGGASIWNGIAGAARFQVDRWFALAQRAEWFDDHEGFATGTGVPQQLKEVTVTAEVKATQGILARLEYRRDWSDKTFFPTGLAGVSNHQNTLTLGVIAFFGPKRQP